MEQLTETLAKRGNVHGNFVETSGAYEALTYALENSINWRTMRPEHKRALRMIIEKISRIVGGDPDFPDHWHDIAGYATLIDNFLNNRKK